MTSSVTYLPSGANRKTWWANGELTTDGAGPDVQPRRMTQRDDVMGAADPALEKCSELGQITNQMTRTPRASPGGCHWRPAMRTDTGRRDRRPSEKRGHRCARVYEWTYPRPLGRWTDECLRPSDTATACSPIGGAQEIREAQGRAPLVLALHCPLTFVK